MVDAAELENLDAAQPRDRTRGLIEEVRFKQEAHDSFRPPKALILTYSLEWGRVDFEGI